MSEARNSSRTDRTLGPGHFYGQVLHKHAESGIILSEFKHDNAKKLPIHSHELAFFSVLLAGHYSEVFGRRTATLGPLTIIFHPSDITHRDEIGESGIRIFSVELQDQLLDRLREYVVVPQSSIELPGSELSWLAMRLYREFRDRDCCSTLAIEGLVLEMLAMVARPQKGERRPPVWLPKVLDLLKANFQQNLTISEVASEIGVHPAYLSRVFRQFHFQTIGDYLHTQRVQFVCRQLANPELALSAIAAGAGFADQSHLTRVFRQFTGMTPGAFRAILMAEARGQRSEVRSQRSEVGGRRSEVGAASPSLVTESSSELTSNDL